MIEINNVTKRYKKYVVPFNSLKSFVLNYKKYKEENKKIEELIEVEKYCVLSEEMGQESQL